MERLSPLLQLERPMSVVVRFGLDLAKNSFSIRGFDAPGRGALRKMVSRSQLLVLITRQASAPVALEAGSGAHHWARCQHSANRAQQEC